MVEDSTPPSGAETAKAMTKAPPSSSPISQPGASENACTTQKNVISPAGRRPRGKYNSTAIALHALNNNCSIPSAFLALGIDPNHRSVNRMKRNAATLLKQLLEDKNRVDSEVSSDAAKARIEAVQQSGEVDKLVILADELWRRATEQGDVQAARLWADLQRPEAEEADEAAATESLTAFEGLKADWEVKLHSFLTVAECANYALSTLDATIARLKG